MTVDTEPTEEDAVNMAIEALVVAKEVSGREGVLSGRDYRYEQIVSELHDILGQIDRLRCDHEWIDIRNEVIKSGEACRKCGRLK